MVGGFDLIYRGKEVAVGPATAYTSKFTIKASPNIKPKIPSKTQTGDPGKGILPFYKVP